MRSVPALRARKGRIQSNLCRLSSLILKMILIKVCPVQRCTMETTGGMALYGRKGSKKSQKEMESQVRVALIRRMHQEPS